MNILQINKYITLNGGSESVMNNLYEILSKDHVVFNCGFHKKNQPYLSNSIDLGEEKINPIHFFHNRRLVESIINIIETHSINLIIIHNIYHHFPMYELLKAIKKRSHAKLLLYLHDYKIVCPTYSLLRNNKICEKCTQKKFFLSFFLSCKNHSLIHSFITMLDSYWNNYLHDSYALLDCIVAPSNFLKSKVHSMGFQHKIHVLHNPIYRNQTKEILPKEPFFSRTKHRIVFAGRLSDEKGIEILVQCIHKLPNIDFSVVGDGPKKEWFLQKITSCKNVSYYGYQKQNELFEIIRENDYLIIPSICYENNPMIILESMSLGTPVIGSNLGGIPELLENKRGFLFNPFCLENLLSVINQCVNLEDNIYLEYVQTAYLYSVNHSSKNYTMYLKKLIEEVI